jgi:hypothetical protein
MEDENQALPEATQTEAPQVAPEVKEEETSEALIERLTKERDEAIQGKEKTQKGLVKMKHKERSRAERIQAELTQAKAELHEYKGTQEQPQAQRTEADYMRMATYKVQCDDLLKDETYQKLNNERALNSTNPFIDNPKIEQTFIDRGISPRIATFILGDDELCERLTDANDSHEIVALLELAKERKKNTNKAPVKVAKTNKPVNAPKETPTQKTNNTASNPTKTNQSTKDWYAQKNANR